MPEPIDTVIRATVARTRLWRDEREQITRELIAHARDAIEVGRSPEQIAQTFGDPRRVARLFRRSMKRKRSLSWQVYLFARNAVAVVLLLMLTGYGVLAVRFYTAEPKIKRDFIAELTARDAGYREDQKAWSVYVEADEAWKSIETSISAMQLSRFPEDAHRTTEPAITRLPGLDETDPDFQETANAVRGYEPYLKKVRLAAARPIVGVPPIFESELHPTGTESTDAYTLLEVLLPNLSMMRTHARVMAFDARLAMSEGDAQRASDDIVATMNFVRQCNQQAFLISRLVGISIHSLASEGLAVLLTEYPGVFTRAQLIEIAHANAMLDQENGSWLDIERMMFDDMLQRTYTDDGHGGGHLTATGVEIFYPSSEIDSYTYSSKLVEALLTDRRINAAARPFLLAGSNDRRAEHRLYTDLMDGTERVLREGPRSIGWMRVHKQEFVRGIGIDSLTRYSVAEAVTPALGSFVDRTFQGKQLAQACATMLAIELYREKHAQLPDSLDRLIPRFLPAIPEDLMDPGRPIKFIRTGDGYLLYSVGSDGDDDGGIPADPLDDLYRRHNERRFSLRFSFSFVPGAGGDQILLDHFGRPQIQEPQGPDGDWILYDLRRHGSKPADD